MSIFKKRKPKTIEEEFINALRGGTLANALDFVAFARANGWTNDDEYRSNFYYMGKPTFVLLCFENEKYPDGEWGIYNYPTSEHDDFPLDEGMKEFLWANVRICTGECGCPNWPRGGDKMVYGKEYKSVCSSTIMFQNPEAEALEKIKALMERWKRIIEKDISGE